MLDNRLKKCAELVSGEGVVCDVGTDHAYLAAELVRSGKCRKVIASDINEGPLETAKKTVEKYVVTENVELILSDGLENVPLEDVTDIVIAGMGGETIAAILEAALERLGNKRLILQPMSKPEYLRKFLYDHHFGISEYLVEEGGKMYTVMKTSRLVAVCKLTEFNSLYGLFDADDPLTKKYRDKEKKRLIKISESLEKAGKVYEAEHYKVLAYKFDHFNESVEIKKIYDYLDSLYPFSTQEKWDNSGHLISSNSNTTNVLLTLDITNNTINEACSSNFDLIISHHPVIFEPLRRIERDTPVYDLVYEGIDAMCLHTNLDKAVNGTNGAILRKFRENFEIVGEPEIFENSGDGLGYGWICTLKEQVNKREFASKLKEIFGCEYVRMNKNNRYGVSRFAFCSGSGGSMLSEAIARECDAYITGDVKHDVWIEANNNRNITLFDCGHFHTENIVLEELRYVLEKKFPQLDIEIAKSSVDPVEYI